MEVFGLSETIDAIQGVANGLIQESKSQIKLAGQAYANDVKEGAPHLSGTLRRSIHVEPVFMEGGQFYVMVGTDLPYARRQEYGFYDMTDSLGRHYYQYARPYFRPPLDRQMGKYIAIMKDGFDDWLESAELAGRSGMIYSSSSRVSSPVSSSGSKARYTAIGSTMQSDFGGWGLTE